MRVTQQASCCEGSVQKLSEYEEAVILPQPDHVLTDRHETIIFSTAPAGRVLEAPVGHLKPGFHEVARFARLPRKGGDRRGGNDKGGGKVSAHVPSRCGG